MHLLNLIGVIQEGGGVPPVLNYWEYLLSLGPKAAWALDETAGTTAIDATGNGHNGTYGGTYLLNQPSLLPSGLGKSVFLDEVDHVVDGKVVVPEHSDLRLSSTGCYIIWATPQAGSFNLLIGKVNCNVSGAMMYSQDGTQLQLVSWGSGGPVTHSTAISAGTHMFVGQWDGATADLYIDGNAPVTTTSFVPPDINTTNDLEMGFVNTCGVGAESNVQFAALFNRRLTPEEIATLWSKR